VLTIGLIAGLRTLVLVVIAVVFWCIYEVRNQNGYLFCIYIEDFFFSMSIIVEYSEYNGTLMLWSRQSVSDALRPEFKVDFCVR
jgi:hypothetical protein